MALMEAGSTGNGSGKGPYIQGRWAGFQNEENTGVGVFRLAFQAEGVEYTEVFRFERTSHVQRRN